jgi:hypothetical protein
VREARVRRASALRAKDIVGAKSWSAPDRVLLSTASVR